METKLYTIKEWANKFFTDRSRPKEQAIRENCRKGLIKNAVKYGRFWYIEAEVKKEEKLK